ncbi:rab-GTPase-TBC domain-containing protein [Mycena rebaudengoi]|nr:rab-GTPase-TBC domain-containing protein [Mycena rebaudengoi]
MNDEKSDVQVDDWDVYRSLSLSPGGFGDKRIDIWRTVLHAQAQPIPEIPDDCESVTHPDERQIRLDTERSFVLYPVDSNTDKDTLQSKLHDLLVEIFRKRPKLNYFQGYHDIVTVLLLTVPLELQYPCAEQLSLQRVRDSMGNTLDPVLGLLRVMRNLLRLADPQYAELLERTSPLPYYALPNLLTLFSHDMPTLPLIQHVFDYLLCRPPIFVVYLASAIVLSRKQEVERLEDEGEEGMMHSLLSALPDIVDDESPSEENPSAEGHILPLPKDELLEDDVIAPMDIKSEETVAEVPPEHDPASDEAVKVEPSDDPPIQDIADVAVCPTIHDADTASEMTASTTLASSPDTSTEKYESPPPSPRRKLRKREPQSLTELLAISDTLHRTYPPTHPSLQLSSIMGPQSVIFTWSTDIADMPSNDEAECMVQRLDLVVYPEPPVVPTEKEKNTLKRRQRRLKKRTGTRTALFVGAGLVLGVAVAVSVYGSRQGGDPSRDWRKLGRWVGGVVAGASERVVRYRF